MSRAAPWFLLLCLPLFVSAPARAGELVGKGQIFLRLINARPDAARVLVRVNVVPNSEKPFDWKGVTVWVGRSGEHSDNPVPDGEWLGRGERSPWIDIGQYMMRRGDRSPDAYLSPALCGVLTKPEADGLHFVAEIARGPGDQILRRIECHRPEVKRDGPREYPWRLGYGTWNGEPPVVPTLGLLIPTNPQAPQRIYTLEESLAEELKTIAGFPPFGRLPNRLVFTSAGRPDILEALGYNGFPPGMFEANLGDEIQLDLKARPEELDRRFRQEMRTRGLDPLELMTASDAANAGSFPAEQQWSRVHALPPLPDRPKQYYESATFRYRVWAEQLGERTRKAEAEHPAQRVLGGANFTPAGSCWPDVRQWIDPFRAGQLTMGWTEDWWWELDETSPQVYGFLLDALRLAGSYHGAPIQFYIMPFLQQTPDSFRRMHALALAHGAKIINHFHTEDQVLTTCDYIDFSTMPQMSRAIHDVIREAGAVEDRLHSAMPERAEVAIMLSRTADAWDTEDIGGAGNLVKAMYNVNNHERKALWLALRHAQLPVDLITDADIADGKLAGYRVLYIVGSEMLRSAAEPLRQWVLAGGVVYATGGCGLLDEYHQPMEPLLEMYGLESHALDRKVRTTGPRTYLPKTPLLDTLVFENVPGAATPVHVPAVCYKETFVPRAGQTAARYEEDHAIGAVTHQFGAGRTVCVGALAGLAYSRPAALPDKLALPTGFPPEVRNLISTPAAWAGVRPPVTASDPLVEAQLLTGPDGDIVVLANWRGSPIADVVIRFPRRRGLKSVRSLRAAGQVTGRLADQTPGELQIQRPTGGAPEVHLRLDISDYLLLN